MDTSPSMRKIAERAGVNRSTVSLALKNNQRLKPATRKKIQKLAMQMGYRKNPTLAHLMSLLRAGQKKHFHSKIAVLNFGIRTKCRSGSSGRNPTTRHENRFHMLSYPLGKMLLPVCELIRTPRMP